MNKENLPATLSAKMFIFFSQCYYSFNQTESQLKKLLRNGKIIIKNVYKTNYKTVHFLLECWP